MTTAVHGAELVTLLAVAAPVLVATLVLIALYVREAIAGGASA